MKIFNKKINLIRLSSICLVLILFFTCYFPTYQTQPLADDELDQEQTIRDSYTTIYDEIIVAQTFKPSKSTLTRVQLFIEKIGEPQTNFTFTLSQTQTGPSLISIQQSTSILNSNQANWIEFDNIDINVNIDSTYYLLLKMDGGDASNNIRWYQSNTDNYDRGYKLISDNNGATWQQEVFTDLSFKTYGSTSYDIQIEYMTGGSGSKINYGITNTGAQEITTLIVQLDILDNGLGFMLTGKSYDKTIAVNISPGESFNDFIYPVIGLGAFPRVSLRVAPNAGPYKELKRDMFFLLTYIYVKPI